MLLRLATWVLAVAAAVVLSAAADVPMWAVHGVVLAVLVALLAATARVPRGG